MKTYSSLALIIAAWLVLPGCSVGVQLSRYSGSPGDDIYFQRGQAMAVETPAAQQQGLKRVGLGTGELEDRYHDVLANDTAVVEAAPQQALAAGPIEQRLRRPYRPGAIDHQPDDPQYDQYGQPVEVHNYFFYGQPFGAWHYNPWWGFHDPFWSPWHPSWSWRMRLSWGFSPHFGLHPWGYSPFCHWGWSSFHHAHWHHAHWHHWYFGFHHPHSWHWHSRAGWVAFDGTYGRNRFRHIDSYVVSTRPLAPIPSGRAISNPIGEVNYIGSQRQPVLGANGGSTAQPTPGAQAVAPRSRLTPAERTRPRTIQKGDLTRMPSTLPKQPRGGGPSAGAEDGASGPTPRIARPAHGPTYSPPRPGRTSEYNRPARPTPRGAEVQRPAPTARPAPRPAARADDPPPRISSPASPAPRTREVKQEAPRSATPASPAPRREVKQEAPRSATPASPAPRSREVQEEAPQSTPSAPAPRARPAAAPTSSPASRPAPASSPSPSTPSPGTRTR